MVTQEKLIELRNSADTRLRTLVAQSQQVESELHRLKEQFSVRTDQLNGLARDIIQADAQVKAFAAVVDEPVAQPAP